MALQLSASRPRTLTFAGGGLRHDLRLLEVDDGLLAEIKQDGVVIKGGQGEGDDAVLCTSGRTYALKYVETTNTLLLLPPDEGGDEEFGAMHSLTPPDSSGVRDTGLQTQLQKAAGAEASSPLMVTATAVAHIEVVRCLPRLAQLRELLAGCRPYGVEDEQDAAAAAMDVDGGGGGGGWRQRLKGSEKPAVGFTTEQLLELVQASRAELLAELAALQAAVLGGRWRLVDEAYLDRLLEVVLLSATEYGWPLGAVPLAAACEALAQDGYRPALVRHCLEVYSTPLAGASQPAPAAAANETAGGEQREGGGSRTYSLDPGRVCLHFARKLLREPPPPPPSSGGTGAGAGANGGAAAAAAGGWPRSSLLAAWAAAVPEEWSPPDPGLLAGEALEELPEGAPAGSEPLLVPFAARDLPLEPAARFAALFERRPRWERSDLEPYMAALVSAGSGLTVESLLLRNARASQATPDAPMLFSAR